MNRTVAVNLRGDEYDHYMGRANLSWGLLESVFHNPFHEGVDGTRAEVIEKFRIYFYELMATRPDLVELLETYRGKRLACWCKPKACHVDVIVEYLEGPAPIELPAQGSLF